MRRRRWAWLAVAIVVLATAAIRLKLLDVPLDRDEGEYAYFGQLLLDGVPPYASAYNLKAPGIYGAYALILAAFGQTTAAIHTGLLLVTSLTTVLVYLLAARLAGSGVGVVAALVFAGQALNPKVLGIAAYAEHFVMLPIVAGWLGLSAPARERRPLLVLAGGLLFGLAFLCKQSAVARSSPAARSICSCRAGPRRRPTGDGASARRLSSSPVPSRRRRSPVSPSGARGRARPFDSGRSSTGRPIRRGSPRAGPASSAPSRPSRRRPRWC